MSEDRLTPDDPYVEANRRSVEAFEAEHGASRTTDRLTPDEATWLSLTGLENPTGTDEDPYSTVEITWQWAAGCSDSRGVVAERKTLVEALEDALKWARGE
jgi:hypothetical protein